jgi:hypothetical protein
MLKNLAPESCFYRQEHFKTKISKNGLHEKELKLFEVYHFKIIPHFIEKAIENSFFKS